MRIVLLGPPGSGKGTQAALLSKAFGLQHIATGDLLRDEVSRQTPLGKKAKTFMDKGKLVPDDLVVEIVVSRLRKNFLLDGFPRSLGQAKALEKILKQKLLPLGAVINIIVRDDVIVARLSKRLVCEKCKAVFSEGALVCERCGGTLSRRRDDNPGTIRKRLRVYREETKPLEEYYAKKELLKNVDGDGSIDEIFARLEAILK